MQPKPIKEILRARKKQLRVFDKQLQIDQRQVHQTAFTSKASSKLFCERKRIDSSSRYMGNDDLFGHLQLKYTALAATININFEFSLQCMQDVCGNIQSIPWNVIRQAEMAMRQRACTTQQAIKLTWSWFISHNKRWDCRCSHAFKKVEFRWATVIWDSVLVLFNVLLVLSLALKPKPFTEMVCQQNAHSSEISLPISQFGLHRHRCDSCC